MLGVGVARHGGGACVWAGVPVAMAVAWDVVCCDTVRGPGEIVQLAEELLDAGDA